MVYHYTLVFESTLQPQKKEVKHIIESQLSHQSNSFSCFNHNSTYQSSSSLVSPEREKALKKHQDLWCTEAIKANNIFLKFDTKEFSIEKSCGLREDNYSLRFSIPSDLEKHLSIDWRFGKIEISGLDMDSNKSNEFDKESSGSDSSNSTKISEKELNTNTPGQPSPSSSTLRNRPKSFNVNIRPELLKARFLGYGVVRLYRDDAEFHNPNAQESRNWDRQTDNDTIPSKGEDKKPNISGPTNTVSILAVPSYFTFYDLVGFLGPNGRDNVSHIRMVRTAQPNRYMVLLRFRTPNSAKRFYEEYNGKLFNSMEAETCQVIYINKIEFQNVGQSSYKRLHEKQFIKAANSTYQTLAEKLKMKSSSPGATSSSQTLTTNEPCQIPYLLDDPFTLDAVDKEEDIKTQKVGVNNIRSNPAAKPAPPPTPMLSELPTCPVCLERMDATATGLLTIPCLHTFHCQCLSKWKDGSCPVCRYSQREAEKQPGQCAVCQSQDNLWICLVCGHIGCGRYDNAHAFDHYEVTGHCYAMDIGTQRVWDYASDSYVHRLLQNQVDGKLVELPNSPPSNAQRGPFSQGARDSDSLAAYDVANAAMKAADDSEKKLSDMSVQLTQMLSSQLESQRDYYESLITAASDRMTQAITRASAAEHENESMRNELKSLQDLVLTLHKQLSKTTNSLDKTTKTLESLEKALDEEKLINEQTIMKLKRLEDAAAQKESEVSELNDTIRDLMFFHEAQAKLQDADEEIKEGTIIVPAGSNSESDTKNNMPKNMKGKRKVKRK